jgi:hypothetical protein
MKINHIRNIVVTIEGTPEDLKKSITFSIFNPMFLSDQGFCSSAEFLLTRTSAAHYCSWWNAQFEKQGRLVISVPPLPAGSWN